MAIFKDLHNDISTQLGFKEEFSHFSSDTLPVKTRGNNSLLYDKYVISPQQIIQLKIR